MADVRVKMGIAGLDEMLGGGVTPGHTVVVMGSFGTGKTTFGLSFARQGLSEGESAIFISLEEDEDSILANARSFGWDLKPYIDSKKLHLIRLEP
jgi:KaiC/GvpD/RAD55 family RecA-like ATPase